MALRRAPTPVRVCVALVWLSCSNESSQNSPAAATTSPPGETSIETPAASDGIGGQAASPRPPDPGQPSRPGDGGADSQPPSASSPPASETPPAGGDGGSSGAPAAGGASGSAGASTGGDDGTDAGSGGSDGSGGSGGHAGSAGVAGAFDGGTNPASGGTTGDAGSVPVSDCQGGKVVHFVYFVEADQPYSESQRDDIERQALVFQQYFYDTLGVTLYLNDPIVHVIEADHDSQWYVDTPDGIQNDPRWYRLGNVKNEVYEKLGVRDFDPDHRLVNYPIARHDGRVGGNFGGVWMDGDDLTCIADDGPTYPYDDGNPAHCLGHLAHEFGHILGLDHEGPDSDCMQYGFYLSGNGEMCTFSEANVQKILDDRDNEGWLDALPGDTCVGP